MNVKCEVVKTINTNDCLFSHLCFGVSLATANRKNNTKYILHSVSILTIFDIFSEFF